ncbi:MAG: hypothetical protein HY591_00475, partial [Candidatus Omnitrophica bacterium]|nr:hypothetical protein [Candidatus Omnitrophota bacterium]
WASSPPPVFASLLRHDFTAVEGPVVHKNAAQKEITVRNSSSGADEKYIADDAQFSSVKEGDTVLILHQIDHNTIGTMVVTQPKP